MGEELKGFCPVVYCGCCCNSAVAVAAKVSLAVDVASCGSVAAASSVAVTVLLLC